MTSRCSRSPCPTWAPSPRSYSSSRRFAGERIELASVAATGDEIAAGLSAQLSARLGHDVRYEEIPLPAVQEQMGDDGVAMFEFFRRSGYGVDIPALHAAYPEVGWHGLDDWIRDHDWTAVR